MQNGNKVSTFQARFNELIEASSVMSAQFAQDFGVSKQAVSAWQNGTRSPKRPTIASIAQYFDVNVSWLMGYDVPMRRQVEDSAEPDFCNVRNLMPMPTMKQLPILGPISCGFPILAEENIEGMATVPDHINATFCLRCVGDSMIGARIYDGDIVYIRKDSPFVNGHIYAVLIDGEATLKYVYRIGTSMLELRPANPSFPVQHYDGDQMNDISIIGEAVAFTGTIRP